MTLQHGAKADDHLWRDSNCMRLTATPHRGQMEVEEDGREEEDGADLSINDRHVDGDDGEDGADDNDAASMF